MPKPDVAPPVITTAMEEAVKEGGAPSLGVDLEPVLTITASAVSAEGGRFTRRAVIWLNSIAPAVSDRPPFYVLDWDRAME